MTDPCQVDFYVLQDESLSTDLLACRLAMMAWEKGSRIMILAENEAAAERLDALMWSHPQGRFLPHANLPQAQPAPVVIGTLEQLPDEAGDVCINLTHGPVPRPQRFQRLLEPVSADDAQRKLSREKFREYRKQGLAPASHPVNRS